MEHILAESYINEVLLLQNHYSTTFNFNNFNSGFCDKYYKPHEDTKIKIESKPIIKPISPISKVPDIKPNIEYDIDDYIENELNKIEDKLKDKIEDKLKDKIEDKLKDKIEDKIEDIIKNKIEDKLEDIVKDKIDEILEDKITLKKIQYNKPIICIDNDETIGSFTDLSLLYSLYNKILSIPTTDSKMNETIKYIMIEYGCLRNNIKDFYDNIINLKKIGLISYVVMCTAASDATGWVTYLRNLIEEWYGSKIYDYIIDGDKMKDWCISQNLKFEDWTSGSRYKDMNYIRHITHSTKDTPVIIVDDRPENVLNGFPINITPYRVALNAKGIADIYIDGWKIMNDMLKLSYTPLLLQSWNDFIKFPFKYTVREKDTELLRVNMNLNSTILKCIK
jgi:hypothetical protein